jgi:hypothetical protein
MIQYFVLTHGTLDNGSILSTKHGKIKTFCSPIAAIRCIRREGKHIDTSNWRVYIVTPN